MMVIAIVDDYDKKYRFKPLFHVQLILAYEIEYTFIYIVIHKYKYKSIFQYNMRFLR